PVAGGVDLAPPEARQLLPDCAVVAHQELAPRPVTELPGARARADDVGEEHGREHPFRLRLGPPARAPHADQELLRLVERPLEARAEEELTPGQLDEPRTRDPLGHVPRALDRPRWLLDRMEEQRWHPDGRQHVTDVDLAVHLRERLDRARA